MLILTVQVFITVSCTTSDTRNDNFFHYEYGDSGWNHGEFWIWTENEATYFEGKATGDDISLDVFAEVDTGVIDALLSVIRNNQIDLWNGFSKHDNNVSDGHGFSLDIQYEKESLHASGYMYEPENYQEGHAALLDFLSGYAANLDVTMPSVESIGYIIVDVEEFRFDLILAMYDGRYSKVDFVNVEKNQMKIIIISFSNPNGEITRQPNTKCG